MQVVSYFTWKRSNLLRLYQPDRADELCMLVPILLYLMLISGGGSVQKVGGLKYSAPNINVYVLMIFTGFSLKSGGALAPWAPYSASYEYGHTWAPQMCPD